MQLQQPKKDQPEVAGFVGKTFEILGIVDYCKIIYWAPNGLEFVIKDVMKFQEIVLPRFFRHNKINSFVRQLNMYGFHKTKHNNFKSTFKHEFFQRDREDLLPSVKRKLKNQREENNQNQEPKICDHQPLPQKPIKQQEPTLPNDKWANLSQQFLKTTKMINLSLVKVSCHEIEEMADLLKEDDCVSIEGEIEQDLFEEKNNLIEFQNVSCFFSSGFNF